jgi:RHS repeat-associated protein
LLSITANGPQQTYTYTSTNTITAGTYNNNGSPIILGGNTYTWDGTNRVLTFANSASSISSRFTYDGRGRLVRVVDNHSGSVVADHSYTWCESTLCLAHDNTQSGSPISAQYFAQGVISSGTPYYYVKDRLGSVIQMVSATGAIAAQYSYDPYGNRSTVSGTLASAIGYAGYFYNAASGLDFTLNRAYDPTHARWLNRDPIGEIGGINLYAYVDGNPISLSDPSGLWTASVGVTVGGQWGPIAGSYSIGVVVDGQGNLGAYANPYVGAGVGAGANIGISVGGSNAPTINDLGGLFGQSQFNVGLGPDVGGSVYAGSAQDGRPVVGGEVSFGVGIGAGGSGGASYTFVTPESSCHR